MNSIKSGFAFHVYDCQLVDFCFDYDEKVEVIKEDKYQDEQALRLRLLQIIPKSRLPRPLVEAIKAYDGAIKALDEARNALDEDKNAYGDAKKAYDRAWEACNRTVDACYEVLKVCEPELIKLHEELCPNCPWNGSTIFTRRDENNQWY